MQERRAGTRDLGPGGLPGQLAVARHLAADAKGAIKAVMFVQNETATGMRHPVAEMRAAVGVDIGCGMLAVKTDLVAADLPESLNKVRAPIERDIPVGFGFHHRVVEPNGSLGGGNHFIEICLGVAYAFLITEFLSVGFMGLVIKNMAEAYGFRIDYSGAYLLASIFPVPMWLRSLGLLASNPTVGGIIALA